MSLHDPAPDNPARDNPAPEPAAAPVESQNPPAGVAPDATSELTVLLGVLAEVKRGDFSARAPIGWTGLAGKVADSLNEVIIANQSFGHELARVSDVVGNQGRLSQRLVHAGWTSSWSESIVSLNGMIDALERPTTEMQRVIGAVAGGDLTKKVTVEVSGEMLELKNTINAMVDQLNVFISELTRVAREVGTEGKLGPAAAVTIEVGGVWKDLTDNVNLMAGNLTGQVRNIAEVTTAVANGDLSKKVSIDVKGEFLELKNTVNAMVDQLNAFAGEVTRVAREVGVEGKLGGQAKSNEIGGVWKDLTNNVNQLAANLTSQVRAIAEVATAVTEGDLTRQISVEARGEVAVLKDKLNEMVRILSETTRQNVEQDWLKTNLERFARIMQGQPDVESLCDLILCELAPLVSAQHGVFYTLSADSDGGPEKLELRAGYAHREQPGIATSYRLGEGLIGQSGKDKKRILLTAVPDNYLTITSGLGSAAPLNIIVMPVLFEGSLRAVFELASFSPFSPTHQAFLDRLTESIGLVLNTIEAGAVTRDLLTQSQSLADELRAQQEELRESHENLERQAVLLASRTAEAEQKRQEVQESAILLKEKVAELAVSSRYKSDFIASLSHEIRSPLNSLMILAELLEDNTETNLTDTQIEYASVIRSSGNDVLTLLNDVLDLAKVESGTVSIDLAATSLDQFKNTLLREFEPVAAASGLEFVVDVAPECPAWIFTDPDRLRQILKNLLSNAFKFTADGSVKVVVAMADDGWSDGADSGSGVEPGCGQTAALAIAVMDTGIGIDDEHKPKIFEEFAQGDATTARIYGGTGLGLAISREYARLLGGDIRVSSEVDAGSTFTVYLPLREDVPTTTESTISPEYVSASAGEVASTSPETRTSSTPDIRPTRLSPNEEIEVLHGTKVLIVDDDIRNIYSLTALLERSQAEVFYAESGAAATQLLSAHPDFDIVLMDIMMPVMDGYETIRKIRGDAAHSTLPILAVTGKVLEGERQRCLTAGADDYLAKPVTITSLLTAMLPWLPSKADPTR